MSAKVVHLVYSFGTGGLERVIVNLINHSKSYDAEHIIVTQTDDHSFADQLNPSVTFYCLEKKEGKDLGSHLRLFRLLRKIKPDVVHTYNFGTLEYQVISWLAGVKTRVHAEHGRESSYKKIDNPWKYELFRRVIAMFLKHFVVVSRDLYSWGQDRLKLKDPKLQLVYNGISLDEFSSDGSTLEVQEFHFTSVGRLVDVKNHELLIDAFAIASKKPEFAHCRLSIVGDGPNMGRLEKQVVNLGLVGRVNLMGARSDIPAILNSSDVFVLSSRYEAQPMTALEAMACNLPVISTNVGGVSFIVHDQENGLLVESENPESLADALVYALNNVEKLREFGKVGRKLVEAEYSVEAMCQSYHRLYGIELLNS